MTRLSQITFINSASFDFAQVELEGNTLFCGANGVGKTTILRAILYFYSANSKKLGLNTSKKKGFNEYYFENLNSYIIYKYKNEHGTNYIVLYKTAQFSPIKFRFFTSFEDIDLQRLFLEEGVALSIDKVISKIRADKIDISNTIDTAKEYRDILYGQSKEYKQYRLLKANNSFNQIHKTISNIFINSKLDSDVIKKSLVSDIEDFIPIDLQNIGATIGKFLEDINVIDEFENNETHIKNAIINYNSYFQKEQLLKDEVNKLFAGANYSIQQEKQFAIKIDENDTKKKKIEVQKEDSKKVYEAKLKKLENEQLLLKTFIKDTNSKKEFYQSKEIEKLLFEESQKAIYESKKSSLEEQIRSLKQKGENEAKKFELLITNKKSETTVLINKIETDKNTIQAKYLEDKALNDKKKEQQNKKLDESYKPLIEASKTNVDKINREIKQLQHDITIVTHKEFLKDEIVEQNKQIQKAQNEIATIELNTQTQRTQIVTLSQKIQKQENYAEQEILKEASKYNSTKEKILKEIEVLRNRLNIGDDSFLRFLITDKNKHLPKITTLLKDEILFANDLNPKKTEQSDTFYGYELDIKEDNSYDERYLKEQIALKNELLKSELKKFEELKEQINKNLQKDISKIDKEKKLLNQSIDESLKKKATLETKLLKDKNELENLELKAKELKETELQKLHNSKKVKELLYIQNKSTFEEHEKEYQNRQKAIKSQYSKEINSLEKIKDEENKKFDLKIVTLNKELTSDLKELEELKEKALQEKGVDTQTLTLKERELVKFKNSLAFIESNMQTIYGYKKDKEEYFDKLRDKKQELKECEDSIKKLTDEFAKQNKNFDLQIEELKKEFIKIDTELKKYQDNLKEFEKIKSGSFYEKIEPLYDTSFEVESFIDISNMQAILFSIDDECNKTIKELKSSLNKIFSKFKSNNILNLNLPLTQEKEELLKSGHELKDFYEQNKIKHFKDTLSSTYSMSLSSYTEQISNLLDASGKIKTTISKINQNLTNLQNINVIQKVELRHQESDDKVVQILKELKDEYNNNSFVNEVNLFNPLGADNSFNNRVLKLFSRLNEYLFEFNKKDVLDLEDSFILEFRAIENGHDTGFVSVLDDIGSNGTDVMIKVMVYIAMLNLSRKSSQKDKNEDIYLHCILDEIGILSPRYLKELISFANSQKIEFLNGAPDEKIVTTYKRVYLLNTTQNHKTMVNEIVTQI